MVSVGSAIPDQNAKRSAQPQARLATKLKQNALPLGSQELMLNAKPILP
jgi:hypothetical protein